MSDWIAPLRSTLAVTLVSAGTLAGELVFPEQADPIVGDVRLLAEELPRVCVYTPEDTLSVSANNSRHDTTTTIAIDCWGYGTGATALADAAAMRDQLAYEVLQATVGKGSFAEEFGRVDGPVRIRRGTEKRGDVTLAVASILITVSQPVDFTQIETEDRIERVHLDYDLAEGGGPDGVIDADQDITITQSGDDA